MRYPNTRYGNPEELRYYAQGMPLKELAKQLRRSEKSVYSWLNGDRKIPFWVPELLRLRHLESELRLSQMGFAKYKLKLGRVTNNVISFERPSVRIRDDIGTDLLPIVEHKSDASSDTLIAEDRHRA